MLVATGEKEDQQHQELVPILLRRQMRLKASVTLVKPKKLRHSRRK